MEKQIRSFNVDFDFYNWTNGIEIKKLREDLDSLEKMGVTSIYIRAEQEYDSAYVTIEGLVTRLETDEELNARIKQENRTKERDLHTFNLIKAKYNL